MKKIDESIKNREVEIDNEKSNKIKKKIIKKVSITVKADSD